MEERLCVVRRWLESEVGTQFVLQYDILVDLAPLPGGGELELFGVAVRNMQTGEETGVPAIFLHMEEAEALVEKLAAGAVTPCTMRDVVEDYIVAAG